VSLLVGTEFAEMGITILTNDITLNTLKESRNETVEKMLNDYSPYDPCCE
jgi:hypothetical protein